MGKPRKEAKIGASGAAAQEQAAKRKEREHAAKLRQLDRHSDLRKKPKKPRSRTGAPKSTQDFIAYKRMMEDGVCEIEPGLYSRTIKFADINYQSARRDDQINMFTQYCELLNYCDSSVHLQMTLLNRSIDEEQFRANMLMQPADDGLDEYRREMNAMLADRAMEGQNSIVREKYLTFTTPAPTMESAIPALARLETDLSDNLKRLGSSTMALSGVQRLELLHGIFHPDEPFRFSYDDLISSGLTTKSVVAPASLDFGPINHFGVSSRFGQCLCLRELPTELGDKVISELTALPLNMIVTLHIDSVDQVEALEYVRNQMAFMEAEVTGKQDKAQQKGQSPSLAVPMETRRSYEEAQKLLDQLENKNQHMFKVTFLIYIYADTLDQLQDNAFQIMATARKNNVRLEKLDFQQREALNSTLPIGKNHVPIQRTLTTATTAIFIPFTAVELYQPGGKYYGLNKESHNLIFFDRESLNVANGMILGSPGSGKSFAAKREMISVLLNDPKSEVLVIDPEREYTTLAQNFGGEVIHISAGSPNHINPMDITMDYSDDDDPLTLKQEFILDLCELLIGGRDGLDSNERSIIDRACKLCYREYFNSPKPENLPTLMTFWETLKAQPEAVAQSLALDLEIYIHGSLSVFSHSTNVDVKNRFVVYDVKDLGKQLRTFGMNVVLDQCWNRITANRNRGIRTWIYIDEIQLLVSNPAVSNYFFELWSRARKWGAIPTGITQNVETLLLSDDGRRMLSNSEFIMMLRQATSDRTELAGLLNISNDQLGHVTNSGPGEGLLFAGKSIVPFADNFPADTELYRMMTTKPDEVETKAGEDGA